MATKLVRADELEVGMVTGTGLMVEAVGEPFYGQVLVKFAGWTRACTYRSDYLVTVRVPEPTLEDALAEVEMLTGKVALIEAEVEIERKAKLAAFACMDAYEYWLVGKYSRGSAYFRGLRAKYGVERRKS
jgi:hypothetical protein